MKLYKLTLGLAVSAMILSSCRKNDYPTFDDADAFVAMQSATYVVGEKDGSIEIPVMLTSLAGLETTVEFEFVTEEEGGAQEGVNYTLASESKTLTFTKDTPLQTIKLNIIDNDSYDGNVKFTISLIKPEGLNLGANSNCVITIRDDEHPLAAVLGTYAASADSYFASLGHFDWNITISTDESDDNKVWIANIDPYFAKYGYVAPDYNLFYGFANEDKTEIHIPVGQELGYNATTLEGFPIGVPLAEADNTMDSGEFITLTILNDGAQLKFENAFGIYDEGWYNVFDVGIVINKK